LQRFSDTLAGFGVGREVREGRYGWKGEGEMGLLGEVREGR